MTDIPFRERYQHDAGCDRESFTPENERGLRTCKDCAGVFDEKGEGVAIQDRRFDENYEQWKSAQEAQEE